MATVRNAHGFCTSTLHASESKMVVSDETLLCARDVSEPVIQKLMQLKQALDQGDWNKAASVQVCCLGLSSLIQSFHKLPRVVVMTGLHRDPFHIQLLQTSVTATFSRARSVAAVMHGNFQAILVFAFLEHGKTLPPKHFHQTRSLLGCCSLWHMIVVT